MKRGRSDVEPPDILRPLTIEGLLVEVALVVEGEHAGDCAASKLDVAGELGYVQGDIRVSALGIAVVAPAFHEPFDLEEGFVAMGLESGLGARVLDEAGEVGDGDVTGANFALRGRYR
jgi:hypothetical protein